MGELPILAIVPTADNYQRFKDQRDHIRHRPEMYIGSKVGSKRISRVLSFGEEGPRMVEVEIDFARAIEHLFLEALSNAGDNIQRTRKSLFGVRGSPFEIGTIEITVTSDTVSITNGGLPIPIQIKEGEGMYVPEMIFGTLMSGSNYQGDQDGVIGTYGYGIKLANIFSQWFEVKLGDSVNKLDYQQVWSDGMKNRTKPVIRKYSGKSFVTVSYRLDFPYFEIKEYSDEMIALFARHAADCSFNNEVPVIFNGVSLNCYDITEYAKLCFGELGPNHLVHLEYPDPPEGSKGWTVNQRKAITPLVKMCVVDTPDEGTVISFVNGQITAGGGVHVVAGLKSVTVKLLDTLNSRMKSDEEGKKSRPPLTLAEVRPHLSMIISVRLKAPKLVGQMKDSLESPTPSITIPPRLLKEIEGWELVSKLESTLNAKIIKKLAKTDGKKVRRVDVKDLEDANEAGGPNSAKCTLYATEGKSAKGFAVKALDGQRDFNGVWPMRGKPLNVTNVNVDRLVKNQEYQDLKKILGLKEGVNYLEDINFNTLRYGSFVVMADADDDGKHILGLTLNIFMCQYPTLLQRGYLMYLKTPIIKVWKKDQTYKFYTSRTFDEWVRTMGDDAENLKKQGWKIKYYKGLGSSNEKDIREEFLEPRIIRCLYDDTTPDTFELAFNSSRVRERKDWISNHPTNLEIDAISMQSISEFMYYEFVEYSIRSVERAIPRLIDGLKESQRKILWGVYLEWKKKTGDWADEVIRDDCETIKVRQLAGNVSKNTNYHHGEKCLEDAITWMAQGFVGTNNLSYLKPDGGFGSRNENGKDHADGRYTYTAPQWWVPYVFRNEDFPLLTILKEEGRECEPAYFLPILPMMLINGATAIATAHSTSIPCYQPEDVIKNLKNLLEGKSQTLMVPWYRGFTGKIELAIRKSSIPSKENIEGEENSILPDDMDPDRNPSEEEPIEISEASHLSMITSGVFTEENGKIIITEIPIGRSILGYYNWLLQQEKAGLISNVRNNSGADTPYFEVTGIKNPSFDKLRLIRSFGLSNMVLLDNNDRPFKFNSANDIIQAFYSIRLPFYESRRVYQLSAIEAQLVKLRLKYRFLSALLDPIKRLILIRADGTRRNESEIIAEMEERGLIPAKELLKISISSITKESMERLEKEIDNLEQDYRAVEARTAKMMWIRDLDEFLDVYHRNESKLDSSTTLNRSSSVKGKGKAGVKRSNKSNKPKGKITKK